MTIEEWRTLPSPSTSQAQRAQGGRNESRGLRDAVRNKAVKNVRAIAGCVVHEVENFSGPADPSGKKRFKARHHVVAIYSAAVMEIVTTFKLAEVIESNRIKQEAATRRTLNRLTKPAGEPNP